MKILVFFDAYASTYEIKNEIGVVGNIDGVQSSSLLQNAGGDGAAGYCVSLEADESKATDIMSRIKSFASQYSGYVANLKIMAYKPA